MNDTRPPPHDLLVHKVTRSDYLQRIRKVDHFELVIIGGGIHGAACARVAAYNGIKTLLLERGDYAAETSSRSSKMVHGGLRYLEMFDFQQVFEGVKAREDLFLTAAHNVRPERFLIPLLTASRYFGWKMKAGLSIYDLFVQNKARAHRWISKEQLNSHSFQSFGSSTSNLLGCFEYCDGLMDDSRLTIDTITDARCRGAFCLNHARVTRVEVRSPKATEVEFYDALAKSSMTIETSVVVNCAGPWAPFIGNTAPDPQLRSDRIRYSQGSHLLFSKRWTDPSLFLPLEETGRYYFVWPHPEGTLVGTTEREIDHPVSRPVPFRDEVDELLTRLHRDIPHMGLNRETLHYGFAGVRTLPVRGGGRATSKLSRKHLWSHENNVLTLYGGKYTTAYWTAYEGVARACELLGHPRPKDMRGLLLEGTARSAQIEHFQSVMRARGVSELLINRSIARFGGSVVHFLKDEACLEPLQDTILAGELLYAVRVEQAETLEDIFRGRLSLEYRPDHGLPLLDSSEALVSQELPRLDWAGEVLTYKNRLASLHDILGIL